MAEEGHSFGPTCAYYEEAPTDNHALDSSPPKVRAQFFYISSVPIDDPLSPVPPAQSDKASTRHPPQPFSNRDNAALEEAWQALQTPDKVSGNGKIQRRPGTQRMVSFPKFTGGSKSPGPSNGGVGANSQGDKGHSLIGIGSGEHSTKAKDKTDVKGDMGSKVDDLEGRVVGPAKKKSAFAAPPYSNADRDERGRKKKWFSSETTDVPVMLSQSAKTGKESSEPVDADELRIGDPEIKSKSRRQLSPFHRHRDKHSRERKTSPKEDDLSGGSEVPAKQINQATLKPVSDMSGRPFARAPSHRNVNKNMTDGPNDVDTGDSESDDPPIYVRSKLHSAFHPHPREQEEEKKKKEKKKKVFIPVGLSRLHLVEMPALIMKPIYWSPINDKASVIRATWFYKNTMDPVEAEVANRLEVGYEDLKPFSASYQDELNACVENGASAELKVVHKLWPAEKKSNQPNTSTEQESVKKLNETGKDHSFLPDAHANAAADPRDSPTLGPYATHYVIYVNGKDAQILKPNQLPSEDRRRRPLNAIRKGTGIGIPVVRGFDRKTWEKVHPTPKMNAKNAHAKVGAYMSQSGDATTRDHRASCPICDLMDAPPKVSDLVLVIHGIGQKLSERVDSYHFTHAINGLRREFNVELSTEAVKGNLRKDTGIMILPVNWRLTVSFEDEEVKTKQSADNQYGLKDITPETLPAVRSLISDVMLDIPYYLSHHKEKMISAVVREANRVYRLWCRNNPGFKETGRVHLIAHSLGSAMAMDILSQQPTTVPRGMDFEKEKIHEKMFEFDTTSLFCCGSPSGFFLLLNKANLLPRKGRNKPGMEGEDAGPGIAGEAGTYGCLAVDNLYNVCHKNDPIAYQQNACVDSNYAASIIPATIPTANVGVLARMGGALRLTSPAASAGYDSGGNTPRPQVQQMPSTVELERHNFSREEIAEKKMYLLNDNGQIDFFLNSGGGPLEFQYLNMLSAHSSYWLLQDFVRFLVVEIGREPGKDKTLPSLRVQKKREFKKGSLA